MREVVKKSLVLSLSLFSLFLGTAYADNSPQTIEVDCAEGGSLPQALEKHDHAKPLIVTFTGTCTGHFAIPGDDITLRGGDSSATIVGSVTIDGRARVRLESFTVRDTGPAGPPGSRIGDGIIILTSQDIHLKQMQVLNAANAGIDIEDSWVELTDCLVDNPDFLGIGIALGSVVHVAGSLTVTNSNGNGIMVADAAQAQFQFRSNVVVSDNAGTGLFVQLKGHVFAHGGSRITSTRNGSGISVVDHGNVVYGGSRITVSNNTGFGVQVGQLADWTVVAGTTPNVSIIDNGGPGFLVSRQAFVRLRENTTITGNGGPGLVVDGAGVAVRGSTVQNNNGGRGDVILAFGSNATFDGNNTFGTPLVCDGTVLVRGQFACPAP